MDECCLLPSQLLIPSLDWLPVSDGLVSRLQPKQPLRLRFGKAPALPGSATAWPLDGLARCAPSAAPRRPQLNLPPPPACLPSGPVRTVPAAVPQGCPPSPSTCHSAPPPRASATCALACL